MSQSRILVFGRNGQLARSFRGLLGDQALFLGSQEADFHDSKAVIATLNQIRPEVVINCSAYTLVDQAEIEKEEAFRVNSETPASIARWCSDHRARFVHFSTDYVFDGNSETPWKESDRPDPLNVYGQSKWSGEKMIAEAGGDIAIFRTSWVYSPWGTNFVKKMLELGQAKEELSIVADQIGSPTYAPDLARLTWNFLTSEACPSGVNTFHVAGSGQTNWAEFASEIFDISRRSSFDLKVQKVKSIPSSAFPTRARRPLFSVLDQGKLKSQMNLSMPHWKESLGNCLGVLLGTF